MKIEHAPKETSTESTAAASFDELSSENDFDLSQMDVMDLHDITHTIDACLLRLRNTQDDKKQREQYQQQLREAATELASHVLSKETCQKLNIQSKILDNQSFNHPPIREDIFRLATASEMLGDETLQKAYEAAIRELPDHLAMVKRRAIRALNLLKSGRSDSFFHAYSEIELIDNGNDTEGRDIMASHAVRFLDFGKLEEDVDYNKLDINDERLERLVNPIPTMMPGQYGTHDEPRVEFYVPSKKSTKDKLANKAIRNTAQT